MHGDTRGARELLPAHPSSVPAARKVIREWLTEVGHDELADDAELAVSELVTNALVHAGTAVEVVASLVGALVRIEVGDGSVHLPHVRGYTPTAGTGRGLKLLDRTVDRWGAQRRGTGKVVWFELSRGMPGTQHGRTASGESSWAELDPVPVDLLNLPLLLHAAWLEHAESLLREHLLVRIDVIDAVEALEAHAAASEALTLLAEQIPTPELDEDPDALMAGAVEPHVSMRRLGILVPRASVPHFAVLDELLDDALVMSDEGLLLTPPTQPEMQELRRWLSREVRGQAAGLSPEPWAATSDLQPPDAGELDWDASGVDAAPGAVVAADDTDRIAAVSAAALSLLGYADRAELVGQRLLALIPSRYHQAHLAGFTMHLSNGRSVLLDRPVVVPVLTRDGSERLVELTVSVLMLPAGRRVFVASLRQRDQPPT